ncbi:uncharacterized protein LOC127379198 isoform X16 [Dicentrarchus labrax]|uniref:uncharacterized protein LOC127379198 isoform X16 n=1 Tax=Dicentrarchus labrax TaxID=13489 RepID=UPI0021F57290|nr:uncharacterized protein LOC127379198 isoform X16 [Dicentrarchus labrax]
MSYILGVYKAFFGTSPHHFFLLHLYSSSPSIHPAAMAAAALSRSRGVAGVTATRGLLFIFSLLYLVCLASSFIDKDQLERQKENVQKAEQQILKSLKTQHNVRMEWLVSQPPEACSSSSPCCIWFALQVHSLTRTKWKSKRKISRKQNNNWKV